MEPEKVEKESCQVCFMGDKNAFWVAPVVNGAARAGTNAATAVSGATAIAATTATAAPDKEKGTSNQLNYKTTLQYFNTLPESVQSSFARYALGCIRFAGN